MKTPNRLDAPFLFQAAWSRDFFNLGCLRAVQLGHGDQLSGVKRANSALRVFGSFSFLFFCRPGARTPRVSGGALRASAAEIMHTYMHMMNSGRSRDPPPYHPW